MKRGREIIAALVVVEAMLAVWRVATDLDDECPGAVAGEDFEYGLASTSNSTPSEALGDRLDPSARITEERNDDKGFVSVTYRGYDADDELLGLVVVSESPFGWGLVREETCDR